MGWRGIGMSTFGISLGDILGNLVFSLFSIIFFTGIQQDKNLSTIDNALN